MSSMSAYEIQRLKNIEYNKSVLLGLGLPKLVKPLPPKPVISKPNKGVKRKRDYNEKKHSKNADKSSNVSVASRNYCAGYMTRSRRLKLKDILQDPELEQLPQDGAGNTYTSDDDDEEYVRRKSRPRFSENVFGSISDVPVGTIWQTRLNCSHDGVHRPTVAGIHGGEEGCYSLALSGGYEDDLDYGDCFTYTGEDVPVGTIWQTRLNCSHDGVHRPTVAGIHGGEEGCYSLALSGGYEDDLDYGDCFTYTGEGGRNLKGTKANPKNLRTAPQSKDQTLTRGNLALSKNVENRKPVRVVRGFKLKSDYAPTEGYRYDGLYTIERYWSAVGLSGFVVYKFALKRCADQLLSPWEDQLKSKSSDENDSCYGSEESSQNQS